MILLCISMRSAYAIDTKELMYTRDRSVYAYSLDIFNLWDEAHKIAMDKSKPKKEREQARDSLFRFIQDDLVSFFEVNIPVYAFPVVDKDHIMRVYEPRRPGFIVYMYKSSLRAK